MNDEIVSTIIKFGKRLTQLLGILQKHILQWFGWRYIIFFFKSQGRPISVCVEFSIYFNLTMDLCII
jgi:hypothetical protein